MINGYWIWVSLIAAALGGVFAALHLALRDLSKAALEDLADERPHPRRARRVVRILDDLDGHVTAVALPRIFCNLVACVALVVWIPWVRGAAAIGWWDLGIGLVGATLLTWLSAAAIAMGVANHLGEHVVYSLSWLVRGTYMCAVPVRKVIGFWDEVVRRLSGRVRQTEAEEAEAELMSAVEEAEREGTFDEAAKEMIEAVVEFRSQTVEQIMTPRTEVTALALTDDLEAVKAFVRESSHSRVPVFEDNLDHVVGVLYAKDLLRWMSGDDADDPGKFRLRPLLRPPVFVPETKTVRELLSELIAQKVHLALVTDEYGGTSGVVTIEDIVEEVFGEIWDEYEHPDAEMPSVRVDSQSKSAEIDARAYIDDVNDELESLGIELPEDEDYDTLGGFVLAKLGHIPEEGEVLRYTPAGGGNGTPPRTVLITVLQAEPTRVLRVRLEIGEDIPPAQGDAA